MSKKKKPVPVPTDPTPASIPAFRQAQQFVATSGVVRLAVAALDLDDDSGEFHENLSTVRRALVDGYLAMGASITKDYHGDALLDRISDTEEREEVLSQLSTREEAGYLYGLALGLALAKGGGR
jgi:hypothetical protein